MALHQRREDELHDVVISKRNLAKLKTAIAAYDRLRAHGVEHAQAAREAAETADLDPEGKLN